MLHQSMEIQKTTTPPGGRKYARGCLPKVRVSTSQHGQKIARTEWFLYDLPVSLPSVTHCGDHFWSDHGMPCPVLKNMRLAKSSQREVDSVTLTVLKDLWEKRLNFVAGKSTGLVHAVPAPSLPLAFSTH